MSGNPEKKWKTLRPVRRTAPEPAVEPESAEPEAVTPPSPPAEEVFETGSDNPVPIPEPEAGPVPVLIAHPLASTTRLIRETLEQFTAAQVFTTPDPLRAFELSLQRRYGIFFFAMQIGELSGPMLYELISKACAAGRGPRMLAPGVVFVREKDDPKLPDGLARDVRVKDVLTKPIRIERLLQCVSGVLEVRDPTARG